MAHQILIGIEALLEEVLDRFYIMVCSAFNFFDSFSVLNRKICENLVHEGLLGCDLLDL